MMILSPFTDDAAVDLAAAYLTMDDIIELSHSCLSHFFDKDTLRFFGSRISSYDNVLKMSDNTYRFVSRQYKNGFENHYEYVYVAHEVTITPKPLQRDPNRVVYMLDFEMLYDSDCTDTLADRAQDASRETIVKHLPDMVTYQQIS